MPAPTRYLLAAGLLWGAVLLAGPAGAVTNWHSLSQPTVTRNSIGRGGILQCSWTAAGVDDCAYLDVSHCDGVTFVIGGSTGTADLYYCWTNTGTRANDCSVLQWDTNGDNVEDANGMDGNTSMKRRVAFWAVPGWVVVDPTSTAGTVNVKCGGGEP